MKRPTIVLVRLTSAEDVAESIANTIGRLRALELFEAAVRYLRGDDE